MLGVTNSSGMKYYIKFKNLTLHLLGSAKYSIHIKIIQLSIYEKKSLFSIIAVPYSLSQAIEKFVELGFH